MTQSPSRMPWLGRLRPGQPPLPHLARQARPWRALLWHVPGWHIPGWHVPWRLAAVALFTLCVGCGPFAPPTQVRGNPIDVDQLGELVPGVSTRADAQSLLGTPTTKGSFDDNTWIYIGEITKPVVASTLHVVRQEVVVLSFDDKGVLRAVKTLSQKDALPVSVVDRITPSPGGNISAWDQIMSGIGSVNPLAGMMGGLGGSAAGMGSTVPGSGGGLGGMGGGMP
jgi:outer membrane protein assembly factor BamE (lipoprotein component of BamABCDE complex)